MLPSPNLPTLATKANHQPGTQSRSPTWLARIQGLEPSLLPPQVCTCRKLESGQMQALNPSTLIWDVDLFTTRPNACLLCFVRWRKTLASLFFLPPMKCGKSFGSTSRARRRKWNSNPSYLFFQQFWPRSWWGNVFGVAESHDILVSFADSVTTDNWEKHEIISSFHIKEMLALYPQLGRIIE